MGLKEKHSRTHIFIANDDRDIDSTYHINAMDVTCPLAIITICLNVIPIVFPIEVDNPDQNVRPAICLVCASFSP